MRTEAARHRSSRCSNLLRRAAEIGVALLESSSRC